jgi:hypothetical protein
MRDSTGFNLSAVVEEYAKSDRLRPVLLAGH